MAGADLVSHEFLRALDHLSRTGAIVQATRGEDVVAEDVLADQRPDARVSAAAAMANSEHPVTARFAERLQKLGDGDAQFTNLDVRSSTAF